MNYLQRKRMALMQNRKFKGYLRTVSGYPVTITDNMEIVSLSVDGDSLQGVGEATSNLFDPNKVVFEPSVSYGYFKIGDDENYTIQVIDKDTSVDITGIYFGVSARGFSQYNDDGNLSVIWMYTAGKFTRSIWTTSYKYFSLYPKNQTTLDKINQRFYIQIVSGKYTTDTMPSYEPYGYKIPMVYNGENQLQTFNIYSDSLLYGTDGINDNVTVNFENKTAVRKTGTETSDIFEIQDWDNIPTSPRGTLTISADTTVPPSNITVSHYADKKED